MNNKYHKVRLCIILASRQLYPPTCTHTSSSDTLSRCPSLPPVSSSPIFVCDFFSQRDGVGPLIHKVVDGRYAEVGIASFVHASGCGCLTQWSSLESLVAWTEFR